MSIESSLLHNRHAQPNNKAFSGARCLSEGATVTRNEDDKGKLMKKLIRIHQSSGMHWVGNGFPVRSVFDYNGLGRELSPFLLLDYAAPYEFSAGTERRGVGGAIVSKREQGGVADGCHLASESHLRESG